MTKISRSFILYYSVEVLPSELCLSLNVIIFPFHTSEQSEQAGYINL